MKNSETFLEILVILVFWDDVPFDILLSKLNRKLSKKISKYIKKSDLLEPTADQCTAVVILNQRGPDKFFSSPNKISKLQQQKIFIGNHCWSVVILDQRGPDWQISPWTSSPQLHLWRRLAKNKNSNSRQNCVIFHLDLITTAPPLAQTCKKTRIDENSNLRQNWMIFHFDLCICSTKIGKQKHANQPIIAATTHVIGIKVIGYEWPWNLEV